MSVLKNFINGIDTQIAGSSEAMEAAGQTGNAQNSFWDGLADLFSLGTAGRQRKYEAEQAAIDRIYQQSSADAQMKFQREERLDQWQKEFDASNTTFQRAVKDLKAAGLNPILAAGAQAPVPSVGIGNGSSGSGSKATGTKGSGEGLKLLASIFQSATSLMGGNQPYKGTHMGFGS